LSARSNRDWGKISRPGGVKGKQSLDRKGCLKTKVKLLSRRAGEKQEKGKRTQVGRWESAPGETQVKRKEAKKEISLRGIPLAQADGGLGKRRGGVLRKKEEGRPALLSFKPAYKKKRGKKERDVQWEKRLPD